MLTSLQHMVFFYVPCASWHDCLTFLHEGSVESTAAFQEERSTAYCIVAVPAHISDNDLTPTDMIPQLYWMCSNGSGSA